MGAGDEKILTVDDWKGWGWENIDTWLGGGGKLIAGGWGWKNIDFWWLEGGWG